MNQSRVLIVIEGGIVQGVFSDHPELLEDVIIRDFDLEGSERDCALDGSLFRCGDQLAREYSETVFRFDQLETQPFACPVSVADWDGAGLAP